MNSLKSNFAGSFYPGSDLVLQRQIQSFLDNTQKTIVKPKALLAPHAGYVYSGQTAAYAYKQLEEENYKTAIILGPTHQVYSQHLAIPAEDSYLTPLGKVDFDMNIINSLLESKLFIKDSTPHYEEHSLEVQIPFLKTMLPKIKIVPISVGGVDFETMTHAAKVLTGVLKPDVLLIISSDLSHYHPLNIAKNLDQHTINQILSLDYKKVAAEYQKKNIECCGIYPIILSLLTFTHLKDVKASLLYYDTSASASFDDQRVVGYASIAFY